MGGCGGGAAEEDHYQVSALFRDSLFLTHTTRHVHAHSHGAKNKDNSHTLRHEGERRKNPTYCTCASMLICG